VPVAGALKMAATPAAAPATISTLPVAGSSTRRNLCCRALPAAAPRYMDGPSKPRAPPKRPPPESDQAPTDRPGQRGALPPDGDNPAMTARRPYPNWSSLTNWRIAAASGPTFGVPSSRVGPNDVLLRAASRAQKPTV
jgi:hypothetical protein